MTKKGWRRILDHVQKLDLNSSPFANITPAPKIGLSQKMYPPILHRRETVQSKTPPALHPSPRPPKFDARFDPYDEALQTTHHCNWRRAEGGGEGETRGNGDRSLNLSPNQRGDVASVVPFLEKSPKWTNARKMISAWPGKKM